MNSTNDATAVTERIQQQRERTMRSPRWGRKLGRYRPSGRIVGTILAGTMLLLTACNQLLDVPPNPKTVPGTELTDPNSLDARMTGAEADFWFAYDMAIVYGGLFTDELVDGTGLTAVDQRRVQPDNGLIGSTDEAPEGIDGLWTPMQRSAATSKSAEVDIGAGSYADRIPDPGNSDAEARMALFAGYSRLILGELFCTTAFDGTGPEYSSAETYQLAADHFTVAIQASNASSDVVYAATVGRARAELQMGDDAKAKADASNVPLDFALIGDVYSTNSEKENNDIWNMLTLSQRFSVGPPFRGLVIDNTSTPDPRVDVFQDPNDQYAIDGSTPLYQSAKYLKADSPIRLASGYEAAYIVAEIDGGQTAVNLINQIRQAQGISQQFSSTNEDSIQAKVRDERRRTLFLEGQRMGDLRRYKARYGLDLFPTGPNFGTETCFPLPNAERDNNPGI
ncbi:MAG: RagB/SusD family nutrient uptake outer membrane protein [Candidatus Palauibacterales bacterium]|nr:RagB/SusD family nutrient uptake outer membrane protein [Candidatus Palauibacterales bacterium]MDP2529771.1 RagB/SusD family nutrient uptake outer membrane protein [Candidatus Palauibacterales bacterium]MDP2585126.1 RagB/SusD family nutrient uptake outer membrane protein [Candidatus Palauibacterales bacterium]